MYMNVKLNGYANDYVCKGMNGGQVVVSPPKENDDARKASGRSGTAAAHSVVGNTVLYGVTGGEMLVRGRAGERFGVRNSLVSILTPSVRYRMQSFYYRRGTPQRDCKI